MRMKLCNERIDLNQLGLLRSASLILLGLPVARDLVQFVQSPLGQAILNQMGFVPRP